MQSEITERAKRAWNSISDEHDQWDALSAGEQAACAEFTAALSDQERAVEVKRLEWKKTALSDNYTWLTIAIAETPFGRYAVDKHDNGYLRLLFGGAEVWTSDDGNKDGAIAAAEAKSAAQADYEQRIRSALVDVPVEPGITTENCCVCGRIIDTREKSEGGDDFGDETGPGKWTCSVQCYDAYVGFVPDEPAPHREGEDSAEVIEALEAAQEWISILQGSTGDVVMPTGDERDPRDIGERAGGLIRSALAATRSASSTSAKGGA